MIGVKAPLRVCIAGGGGDHPSYFNDYGCRMISFAINQYSYIFLRRTPEIFDHHSRLQYSKIEEVLDNSEIEHPGIRGVLEFLDERSGVEVVHLCDIPSRSGLGGSSSFVVALLAAVHELNGTSMSQVGLAEQAVRVERGLLGEPGGHGDQYGCATPGAKEIVFTKDSVEVKPLDTSLDFLNYIIERSILLYTGRTERESFEIVKSYSNKSALQYKHEIRNLADEMIKAFKEEDQGLVGRLLHKSWVSKRSISPMISNPQIDSYYETGLACGAVAGKLLGAGQSGFMYFLLGDNVDKEEFAKRVGLHKVDFELDTRGVCVL